jgi:hypothetical protein
LLLVFGKSVECSVTVIEQRGFEQRNIDRYGAQTVSGCPEFNQIEGVSQTNQLRDFYSSAADTFPY